jgi:hypothetical protein
MRRLARLPSLLLLLLLIAVPAHATVSNFPCTNELRAKEDAWSEYDQADRELSPLISKSLAAAQRVERLEKALRASTASLRGAEQAYHAAAENLAGCLGRKPSGGCGAQRQSLQGAKARLDRAKSENMKAFGAWTKALSDLEGIRALEREATEKMKQAHKRYREASEALEQCEEAELEKKPDDTSEPPPPPKKKVS